MIITYQTAVRRWSSRRVNSAQKYIEGPPPAAKRCEGGVATSPGCSVLSL
jgi:hypothetical protein